MENKPASYAIYGSYYLMLTAYLVVSFFPEYRVWGFNWWAYYPDWVRWTLFGLGALVPVVLRFIPQTEVDDSNHFEKAPANDRKFFICAGIVTAISGSLFYLLRARTHFLGDGYQLLSELAKDSVFAMKTRNLGESVVHLWLKNVISGDGQAAALLSYQIISITAGLLFVVVVALFARKLYEYTAERVLFLLGVCTGGYMLLFFGYVENYSLFVLSVLTYTLTGLLIAQGKARRYWLLPPLIAAVFFHVLGVTLIPSALYVWIGPSRIGKLIRNWRPLTRLVAAIPIAIGAAIVFHHFYTTNYFFRFAFVPFIENRFTVEGYTMFSMKHMVDCLNLLFLLAPGLLVVTVSLSGRSVGRILKQRPSIYLLILTSSVLGAVFIFDPKLGMPRDWDLFSFAGAPVAVSCYYFLLGAENGRKTRNTTLICFGLGLLCLFPRVVAQRNPESAVGHLVNYRYLDSAKCRNAHALLAEYDKRTGDSQFEQIRLSLWIHNYEQEELFDLGMAAMNAGDFSSGVNLFKRACEVDPLYWNSWATVGACYGQLGMTDAAKDALDIAEGINPHGAAIFSNRGILYTQLGRYRDAETMFLKCLEIDSSHIAPYTGLVNLYKNTGRETLFRKYLMESTSRPDAPDLLLAELGYYMISKKRFAEAADAYRRAMDKGLDSAYVKQLIEQYPQLGQHLK